MTAVRKFTPPNRLAKVLIQVGGRTAEEAIATADARLDALEPPLRRAVNTEIARILALHREGEAAMFARSLELADAALNIAEIAGAAKLPDVGEVARGIRAMIDSLMATGLWHTDALDLHISALSLLSGSTAAPPEAAATMLGRLHAMRVAIGVQD